MDQKNFRVTFLLFPLLVFALWQNGSCRSENRMTQKTQNRVAAGVWGGPDVRMDVTDAGASLQFSCSSGTIDESPVASEGQFQLKGTFTRQTPGPTRENGPEPQPATYRGSIENQKMTLTVTLASSKEQVGSFTLEFGKPGRVRRCH
jgi:hypothetical protein